MRTAVLRSIYQRCEVRVFRKSEGICIAIRDMCIQYNEVLLSQAETNGRIGFRIEGIREGGMNNASQYRASASLCRQAAAYNPDKRWELASWPVEQPSTQTRHGSSPASEAAWERS